MQIARSSWGEKLLAEPSGLSRLRRLERTGWVKRLQMPSHPELELRAPVYTWRPSCPAPNYGAVSYALKKRWRLPLQTAGVVVATEKAGKLFGGAAGRVQNSSQVTHDLHVSALFLRFRGVLLQGEDWIGEDRIAKEPGKKHPDALIVDRGGRPRLFVEFGGSYAAERVEKLHRHCSMLVLPYELW